MVSSFFKFEHLFSFLKFGHFFCPFLNSRKKSLKKKIYKTINPKRGLKNRVKKEPFWPSFSLFVKSLILKLQPTLLLQYTL